MFASQTTVGVSVEKSHMATYEKLRYDILIMTSESQQERTEEEDDKRGLTQLR